MELIHQYEQQVQSSTSPMDLAMEDIAREMARDDVIVDLLSKDRRNIPYFATNTFCSTFLKECVTVDTSDVVTTLFSCTANNEMDPLIFEGVKELTTDLRVKMRYKTTVAIPFCFGFQNAAYHANMIIITRLKNSVVIEHFEPFGGGDIKELIRSDIFGERLYRECELIFKSIYEGLSLVYFKPADFQKTWFSDLNIQSEVLKEQRQMKIPLVWTLTCVPISLWYGFKRLQMGVTYSSIQSKYGQTREKYMIPITKIVGLLVEELKRGGSPSQTVISLVKDQLSQMNLKRDINYFQPPSGLPSFIYVYHAWGYKVTSRSIRLQQFAKQTPKQKVDILLSDDISLLRLNDAELRSNPIFEQISSAMKKYFGILPESNFDLNWRILIKRNLVVAFFSYKEDATHIEIYNVCSPAIAPIKEKRRMSYIKQMLTEFVTDKPQYLYVNKNNYYFVNACRTYYYAGFRLYQVDDTPKQERIFMIRRARNGRDDGLLDKFIIVPELRRRYIYTINKRPIPMVKTISELLTDRDVVLNIDGVIYQLNPLWRNLLKYLETYDESSLDKSLLYLYINDKEAFNRFTIKPVGGVAFYDVYLQPVIIPVPNGYYYT